MPSKTHGLSRTYLGKTFETIKRRCESPKHISFPRYGGKGIKCLLKSPQDILDAIGHRPTAQHSVDRYPDSQGHYEKGNIRWATPKEQSENRKNTVWLTHNGEARPLARWAEKYSLNIDTLRDRIDRGWTTEDALKKPVQKPSRSPSGKFCTY